MKTDRPVSQAFPIKKRQVVQDRQIDGIVRNSSGVQKIFEGTTDSIVSLRSRFPPTFGDEAKDGVGEAGGVKPPEIFQMTRCSCWSPAGGAFVVEWRAEEIVGAPER